MFNSNCCSGSSRTLYCFLLISNISQEFRSSNILLISNSFADHPASNRDRNLHPDYPPGPQVLKFCRSIELPPPAPRSGNGRGNGDIRLLREPSPARVAEGAAAVSCESHSEADPRGGLAACEHEQQRQEIINLLAPDELVELLLLSIIQDEFSMIPATFCIAGCICLNRRCLGMGQTGVIHGP